MPRMSAYLASDSLIKPKWDIWEIKSESNFFSHNLPKKGYCIVSDNIFF